MCLLAGQTVEQQSCSCEARIEVLVVGGLVPAVWRLTGEMEMISGGGKRLTGTALFCALSILLQRGDGAVIMEWTLPSAAAKGLEDVGQDIYILVG